MLLTQEACRHRHDRVMNKNCCSNIELCTLMPCLNNNTLNDNTWVQLTIWTIILRVLIKISFQWSNKRKPQSSGRLLLVNFYWLTILLVLLFWFVKENTLYRLHQCIEFSLKNGSKRFHGKSNSYFLIK